MPYDIDKKKLGQDYISRILEKQQDAETKNQLKKLLENDDYYDMFGDDLLRKQEGSRIVAKAEKLEKETADYHKSIGAELARIKLLEEENKQLKARKPIADDQDDENSDANLAATKAALRNQIDTSKFLTIEDYQRGMAQGYEVAAVLPKLAISHLREFDKELDTIELVNYCNTNRQSLTDGYNVYVKEARETKRAESVKLQITEAEKRGRDKAISELQGKAIPYLVNSDEPTTLSGLGAKDTNSFGVDAAVANFNKLRGTA